MVDKTGQTGRTRRILLSVLGAVAVGIIGNGIWDVIAKPGMNRVASTLLTLFTLGSSTVRDLPYSSAALDPHSLPALLFMYVSVMLLPFLFGYPLLDIFLKPWLLHRRSHREKAVRLAAANDDEAEAAVLLLRTRRRRTFAIVLSAYGVLIFSFAWASFTVVNRAIFIRRIYEANMQILSPYISQTDFVLLRGRFASVKTKGEYYALQYDLERIAEEKGVPLRSERVR